ncbi:uncharacterized protein TNCV_328671 [Trichonephila clavipes]|nr:uncharacterized protein TNCV_328671 [Trichonephila clavipes]
MKFGNNGNLVLGPFDESTPCLMIVLMNCQTKLRINHLTAVKSVAILEIDRNSAKKGRDSLVVKVSDRGWNAMSSNLVQLKIRRVGERCALNLSRAQTSSRWCGVKVKRGGYQLSEPIFGGDQGDTPEIMDEILTTARDLELEVNEDDIEELIMGHEDELTTELQETQRNVPPSEEEEDERGPMPTSAIKNILKKWEAVRAMVLE